MDASFLIKNETTEVIIKDVNGVDTDFVITLLSPDSREYWAIQSECKIEGNNERFLFLMANATKGWVNLNHDGKPVEFSIEAALEWYYKMPKVLSQLIEVILKDENFMKSLGEKP